MQLIIINHVLSYKNIITLYVLVNNTLQPVQSLYNPQGFSSVVIKLFLMRPPCNFDVAVIRHIIGDPSDVEQTQNIGHAA